MSEKDRNEITRVLTEKDIEDLGAPYLSMAEAPPQASYNMPPPTSYGPAANIPVYGGGSDGGPLSLGGFANVAGGMKDKINRLYPSAGVQMRYGRSF